MQILILKIKIIVEMNKNSQLFDPIVCLVIFIIIIYFPLFFSGLISAREFVKVFPDLRNSVVVPSSVYNASINVRIGEKMVILVLLTIM